MAPDDIKVEIEHFRGDIKALDTVVRMSIAEQRRINVQNRKLIEKLFDQDRENEEKISQINTKIGWFSGIIITLMAVIQGIKALIRWG